MRALSCEDPFAGSAPGFGLHVNDAIARTNGCAPQIDFQRQKRAGGNNGQPQKHTTSQRRGEACLRSSRVAKRTLFCRRDLWSRFIRPSVRIAFVRYWSIRHGQTLHLKTGPFGLPASAPCLQRTLEATSLKSSADLRLKAQS